MAKSKTQPEEVAAAEAEVEAEQLIEGAEVDALAVPVGGNTSGEVPPSMR